MVTVYALFLVAVATSLGSVQCNEDVSEAEKRLISTFQIVRFPNDACTGSSKRNGTCYTSAECSDKGGTSSGSCADGFGVCCTFLITTCGKSSSENITYWDQTPTVVTTAPSSCSLSILPLNDNICQLRIDFTTFVITGPSTSSVQEHYRQLGSYPRYGSATALNAGANWRGNCLIDRFSVNGVSTANIPPVLCGTNSGVHMYVDSNPEGNDMEFTWSGVAGSTPALTHVDSRGLSTLATRDWDMTIYQYECGYINQAPPGCTQWIWDTTAGRVTSFNWSSTGQHLANQNQKICIRRERSICFICFAGDGTTTSFAISGEQGSANGTVAVQQVCGYACENANGLAADGNRCGTYDCGIIPGAFVIVANIAKETVTVTTGPTAANIRGTSPKVSPSTAYRAGGPSQFSSNAGVLGVGGASEFMNEGYSVDLTGDAQQTTICSWHNPFMFIFKSDDFEGTGEEGEYGNNGNGPNTGTIADTNEGVNLNYATFSCT